MNWNCLVGIGIDHLLACLLLSAGSCLGAARRALFFSREPLSSGGFRETREARRGGRGVTESHTHARRCQAHACAGRKTWWVPRVVTNTHWLFPRAPQPTPQFAVWVCCCLCHICVGLGAGVEQPTHPHPHLRPQNKSMPSSRSLCLCDPSIGLLGPTEIGLFLGLGLWGIFLGDSSLDSDSRVQSKSDSSLDSDSRVQSKSDSSLDSGSGARARSDFGLDSDSWFARAWGLAGGFRRLLAGIGLGKEQPPPQGKWV
jgi:hypothetical protein